MSGAGALTRLPRQAAAHLGSVIGALAFALWLGVALDLGPVFLPVPAGVAWTAIVALPVVGLLCLLLLPQPPRTLRLLVGGMWLVLGAVIGWILAAGSPPLVLGAAAVALTAVAARRWPAQTVFAIFAISGTYGSIDAFTALEPGPTVDFLLGALWLGLLPRIFSRRRDYHYVLWPGVAALFAYALFTVASVPFAPDTYEGLRAFRQATWYMLSLVVVGYLGLRPPTRDQLAVGVVVVCALVGAYATLRWAIGPAAKEKAFAATTGDLRYETVAGGDTKLQGSLENGSVLGLWTAVTIPFCVAAALGMRGKARLAALVAVPLLTVGLLGSQVRTASVAAIAGVGVVVILYQLSRGFRGPRLGMAAGALVAVGVTAAVIFPNTAGDSPEKVDRYRNILTPSRDFAFQERRFKWDSALRESVRTPLGRGLGTAGFRATNQRFPPSETGGDVDNSYVMVAFEQGFAVMVFYIGALLVLLAGVARRAVWTVSERRATIAVGAAGTLTALMVMFFTRLYIQSLASLAAWIIVGLGVAEFSRADRSRAKPAA